MKPENILLDDNGKWKLFPHASNYFLEYFDVIGIEQAYIYIQVIYGIKMADAKNEKYSK